MANINVQKKAVSGSCLTVILGFLIGVAILAGMAAALTMSLAAFGLGTHYWASLGIVSIIYTAAVAARGKK